MVLLDSFPVIFPAGANIHRSLKGRIKTSRCQLKRGYIDRVSRNQLPRDEMNCFAWSELCLPRGMQIEAGSPSVQVALLQEQHIVVSGLDSRPPCAPPSYLGDPRKVPFVVLMQNLW